MQVWDYQTKSCVQTLEGHTHNVSAVCFHPELPIIISGSEDGTVRIWHSTTYRSGKRGGKGAQVGVGVGRGGGVSRSRSVKRNREACCLRGQRGRKGVGNAGEASFRIGDG